MNEEHPRLLIATRNRGKIREFAALSADLDVAVVGLEDLGISVDIPETGGTFAENAMLKARGYALQAGCVTLADDSGLEVVALDGRPGVLSARYGGSEMPFDEKMRLLLAELDQTAANDRRARFIASIAVADHDGRLLHLTEGICTGRIADSPRGNGGFGYDPLFIPDGYDQTFGELPDAVKQNISHRARAFSQIIPFLRGFFAI